MIKEMTCYPIRILVSNDDDWGDYPAAPILPREREQIPTCDCDRNRSVWEALKDPSAWSFVGLMLAGKKFGCVAEHVLGPSRPYSARVERALSVVMQRGDEAVEAILSPELSVQTNRSIE